MNEYLEDAVNRLAEQIPSIEGRDRRRKAQNQFHFLHGIEHLIVQLWKGTQIQDGFEAGVNKRAGWYSEHPQFKRPNLSSLKKMTACALLAQECGLKHRWHLDKQKHKI